MQRKEGVNTHGKWQAGSYLVKVIHRVMRAIHSMHFCFYYNFAHLHWIGEQIWTGFGFDLIAFANALSFMQIGKFTFSIVFYMNSLNWSKAGNANELSLYRMYVIELGSLELWMAFRRFHSL